MTSAAMMYASAVGGAWLAAIAILLLALLTIGVAGLALRTVYALCSGRFLNA